MSNEWKTPKGTTLYLISLKGKPYLPVAERLIWFREENPDWSIRTEFITLEKDLSIAKATIINGLGKEIANAHKHETKQGFADHIEKSETGAIGRALALCGYGTQFCADDFDEGDRLADAPRNVPVVEANQEAISYMLHPRFYEVKFGKQKGKTLEQLGAAWCSSTIEFIQNKATPQFANSPEAKEFLVKGKEFLASPKVEQLPRIKNEG